MERYVLGTGVRLDATWKVNDVLTDPTEVSLTVSKPDGTDTVTVFPTAPIVRDAEGVYHAEVIADAEGMWQYRFAGTGAAQGANEGEFYVYSDVLDTLELLTKPADYNGIRNVLGVEEIDVSNENIDNPMFGPQAEIRVKSRIPDWQAYAAESEEHQAQLAYAAAYITAALIAESMANGGFIGLVDEGRLAGRDWRKEAALHWSRAEEWLLAIEHEIAGPTDPTEFPLPMMRVTGPTRDRIRRYGDVPRWVNGFPAQWGGWSR
jgi:hypothetical protein